MPLWEALVVVLAGLWAGTINTIVGSGTLITFPVLLLLGLAPLEANMTNSLGLAASGLTAPLAYRAELRSAAPLVRRLVPMTLLGSLVGAALLLVAPPGAFAAVVPVLVALALVLVVTGPRLNAWAARHRPQGEDSGWHLTLTRLGVLGGGVYGGYFGAAQGVLLMGLMTSLLDRSLHEITAVKNVLVPLSNVVAALVFVAVARDAISWGTAALLAVGALGGGWLGGRLSKRFAPAHLRAVIVVVGLVALGTLSWP